MATNFFLRYPTPTSPVGGAGSYAATQMTGASGQNVVTATTAGGTNIQITISSGGQAMQWFSGPITAAVTVSGTVTVTLRGLESANTVNAAAGILIQRTDNAGTVLSTIVPDSVVGAEYGTSGAQRTANFTPTSTAMGVGERIRFVVKVRNVGTMGAGTVTNNFGAQSIANAPYITFTENIVTDEIIDRTYLQGGGMYGYN